MVDHNYRVHLKRQTCHHVIASTLELHGDHLVFVKCKGSAYNLFSEGVGSELEYAAQYGA
jgi:hypothetical protein